MINPELNREYPAPDEARLIEEMVKIAVGRMKPQQGRIRRGQHAKATVCVRGGHHPLGSTGCVRQFIWPARRREQQ